VANEKTSRAAVVELAANIADTEGVNAVTIRRLAQELGITPMALYWHFKNKDELVLGLVDHLLGQVIPRRSARDPWQVQLRAMVQTVVELLRAHPSLPVLLKTIDKKGTASFNRVTNDALELLSKAGFDLEESYWVASYLLNGAIGLVEMEPGCPLFMSAEEGLEVRRQRRLQLEALSPKEFPMMVAYAETLKSEPDVDRYYAFGMDLLLGAITARARK
jgi:TetR/AcrR family tetracycline transcriptional repressor